jgi:hypothetical protein
LVIMSLRDISAETSSCRFGFDSRLQTLICNELVVMKSKEVRTGCNPAKSSNEAVAQRGLFGQ